VIKVSRGVNGYGTIPDSPFDVDRLLAQLLVARLATTGPVAT
jgi:hypothetical protein